MAAVNPVAVTYGSDASTTNTTSTSTSTSTNNGSPWTVYHITGAIVAICFVLFVCWYFLIRTPEQIAATPTIATIPSTVSVSKLSDIPLSGGTTTTPVQTTNGQMVRFIRLTSDGNVSENSLAAYQGYHTVPYLHPKYGGACPTFGGG